MTDQQGLRQTSVRAITGTARDYNGDWSALFDLYMPAGDWNARLLQWINLQLLQTFVPDVSGANQTFVAYTDLSGAMAAFAAQQGVTTWSEIGSFNAGISFHSQAGAPNLVAGAGAPSFDWPVPVANRNTTITAYLAGRAQNGVWQERSTNLLVAKDVFYGLAGAPNFDWSNPRGYQFPIELRGFSGIKNPNILL